jgi:hypothetical protein
VVESSLLKSVKKTTRTCPSQASNRVRPESKCCANLSGVEAVYIRTELNSSVLRGYSPACDQTHGYDLSGLREEVMSYDLFFIFFIY